MNDVTKEFVKNHLYLIDEENWEELYRNAKARFFLADCMSEMTELLYECGADVFRGDHALTEIPTGFLSNTQRTKFNIPDTITRIGAYSFSNSRLERITIPQSVEEIAPLAFENCKYLKEVEIQTVKLHPLSTVSSFGGCWNIRKVIFSGSVDEWMDLKPGIELRAESTVTCSDGEIKYDYEGEELR